MLVTPDLAPEILGKLDRVDRIAFDTETTGLHLHQKDKMVGVSVYNPDVGRWYFPFRHVDENLPGMHIKHLIDIFKSKELMAFNAKFDLQSMNNEGMTLPDPRYHSPVLDPILAAHMVNENEPNFALKPLASRKLGQWVIEGEAELNEFLTAKKLSGKGDLWKLPASQVSLYAAIDAQLVWDLIEFYKPHLEMQGLYDLWIEQCKYSMLVGLIEKRGILLDWSLIEKYKAEAIEKAAEYKATMWELAGFEINPNSAKQLQRWLEVPSTKQEILERMQGGLGKKDPRFQALLSYRGWNNMVSRYYNPLAEFKDDNGIVHPNLKMIGTISSRLSCTDPNAQAIAKKLHEWSKVKDCFIAPDGYHMVQADFSQAEMRVASWYGQEKAMTAVIESGENMHDRTSRELGIPRDAAKTLNFSVIYGIGPKTLGERLNVPMKEAKVYLDRYHSQYPGFRALLRRAEQIARQKGHIRMFTGRLRHFNAGQIISPTHKASSNLVQGSVAEITRISMQRCHDELGDVALQWFQVHDSIMFFIRKEHTLRVLPEIKRIMEDFPQIRPRMTVDISYGESWGALEEWVA